MTLFDLVTRSMRKNIKHYYLYFFALIFSVALYFVFATLQYDSSIVDKAGASMNFASSFKAASVLLIFIAGVFIIYANAIFLKRRSREIGLYQLIGLNKGAVVRLLIIENIVLGIGALLVGIVIGMLVSRVFLLLLMKLIGYGGVITLSFSMAAVTQTSIVFLGVLLLTTIQMIYTVYRNTLLNLFNADQRGELPRKPKTGISATLAIFGIAFIGFGYWFSGRMLNEMLFFNMLIVLGATILGTYLLFRVTIGWAFYQIRARKQGHLGLKNSLSIASLMHRMKGNANSLTIITVLSATTLALISGAYSLFYSTEKETRFMMPYDFMFSEEKVSEARNENDLTLVEFEDKLKKNDITYLKNTIETLEIEGQWDASKFPPVFQSEIEREAVFTVVSDKQLEKAGYKVEPLAHNEAILHSMNLSFWGKEIQTPFQLMFSQEAAPNEFEVKKLGEGNVLNAFLEEQVIVSDANFEQLKVADHEKEQLREVYAIMVPDQEELAKASEVRYEDQSEERYGLDYYSMYESSLRSNGLLIFIAGFLGLVFLISTGSILYFKQMTEAEQEKQSYKTLRQLGFTVKDIMSGIVRKQIFVFGLPLAIGLLHSIFAIKSASFLFTADITVPTVIAMGAYALIYLLFAILSIGYYKKTVSEAL